MAEYTEFLGLLKKDPVADATDTFNIQTMLNENWDKVDEAIGNMSCAESGTYVGTGEGNAHTFSRAPKAVFIFCSDGSAAVHQSAWFVSTVFALYHDSYTWNLRSGVELSGNALVGDEINVSRRTYYYIAWF